MSPVAVFDINETTLDLTPVRLIVDEVLAPAGGFVVWFQRLLQLSMTATTTENYEDFSMLARAALDAVAATTPAQLPSGSWDRVAAAMSHLDPYPDVVPALQRLRSNGWSTIALTNSAPHSVNAQLERAGLTRLFDAILSVDVVKAYKPARAPYLLAAEQANASPSDMWMVACHDWDLAGARTVGMSTAYVSRPGMSYADTYARPELWIPTFTELADALLSA